MGLRESSRSTDLTGEDSTPASGVFSSSMAIPSSPSGPESDAAIEGLLTFCMSSWDPEGCKVPPPVIAEILAREDSLSRSPKSSSDLGLATDDVPPHRWQGSSSPPWRHCLHTTMPRRMDGVTLAAHGAMPIVFLFEPLFLAE